ncbi:trypsin-like peptidase domain-containing protein [Bradyrhizobium ganzhouense]|uniref:trypsin-like peptidase domain-containing protein n=1 Tax=Bradyrhizobium ganzhouense TaxID=1179767 RepID=UPI003CF8EF4A
MQLLNAVRDPLEYSSLVEKVFAGARTNPSIPLLKQGNFRTVDFMLLVANFSTSGSTNGSAVTRILKKLLDLALVGDLDLGLQGHYPYAWQRENIETAIQRDILSNLLRGPSFIVERYRPSVVAIEVVKGRDIHVGTGFFVNSRVHGPVLVTAKHNVDPDEGVSVRGLVGTSGSHYQIKSEWIRHSTADLAFVPIELRGEPVPINLASSSEILEQTITLGFPKVSTADNVYLLAHRGELNAKIKSYQDQSEYLLISNSVSPGSSGSPVLNTDGEAIGLVVRSLETRHEGGINMVSSAVPAQAIAQFIEKALG